MSSHAKWQFYILLVLCFFILLTPILLRQKYSNKLLIGEESYNSLRYAEYIHEHKEIPKEDSYSYGSRSYINELGYPLLLSINPSFLSKFLPILIGLLTFIIYYKLIGVIKPEVKTVSSLLFIISPAFIYLFSISSKYGISLLLLLLAYLLHKKGYEKLVIISLALLSFFSFILAFLALLIILFYSSKEKGWKIFFTLLVLDTISFLIQFSKLFVLGVPETIFGPIKNSLTVSFGVIFSDFGSKFGVGLFLFFLSIFGIYKLWNKKFTYVFVYLALLSSLFLALFFNAFIVIISTFLAFTGAIGFNYLAKREWKSEIFRYVTLLVLVCGLIFSTLAYYNRVSTFTPSQGFGEGLTFLKQQNSTGLVFSHYTRGIYLSYAEKPNFMDTKFLYAPNFEARYKDSERILHGKNIQETSALINRYGIKYIWLDKELIESLWGKNEVELLFFLRYSPENFEKVFDNGDVEIYEYVGLENKIKITQTLITKNNNKK